MIRALRVVAVATLTATTLAAQQGPDRSFRPTIARPAWGVGAGPRLCVDEAHHNFHTLAERFWAFGELARRDGYRVAPNRAPFTPISLASCDLLVISNAMPSDEPWERYPTPTPSAFTDAEIAVVRSWVEDGGQLLLIADHQPLAGAAAPLALAFGAEFTDGFAYPSAGTDGSVGAIAATRGGLTLFRSADGTLTSHAIVGGRDSTERVSQVRTFTGQGFRLEGPGTAALLVLPSDYVSLEPRYAWQFDGTTQLRAVGGWYQGATRRVGAGRVAIFGEAAMFSAQRAGPAQTPVGMNAPMAEENAQFVLNVLHWLSGLLHDAR